MNGWKTGARLLFAILVVSSMAVVASGYLSPGATAAPDRFEEGNRIAESSGGVTVIATDSNSWLGQGRDGPRAKAELLAIGPDGRVLYYNDSHTRYWDVDPVEGTNMTVEYVAADHLSSEECGGDEPCTRNVVERVNLTTGETEVVFERVTPGKHSTRWHDVDRIDEDHIVVADIAKNRVFVVNTTSGMTTWAWSAQSEFRTAGSGGPYPSDWTHINDVEVLDDGRIMVSMRNHDQVVFLSREDGLNGSWTLGSDGNHDVLYEQHNPDYIPADNGGPAVLVGDSENNRVVEYQRQDGEWQRTWTWSDDQLRWPRDADRLPNGNTLITDSNGNRVLVVDERGEIVWSVNVGFPYEAERLGTGEESAGGPAAQQADLESVTEKHDSEDGSGAASLPPPLRGLFHGPTANAVMYVLPVWVGQRELFALVSLVMTTTAWGLAETYWSDWSVTFHRPVGLDTGD